MKYFGYILLTLILGQTPNIMAQTTVALSGTAVDLEGGNVEFADIILLQQDSTVHQFTFITNGQFIFEKVELGEYIIYVNALNYVPFYQSVDLVNDLNVDLVLKPTSIELDELTISTRRKIFDNKNGNITFNIENTFLDAEPNTVSLMAKLPYVQINPDGESISIVGRGTPLIYQNNQRIDLIRMNNISVDDIESIEIINNPSAKYEAEGRSVIIIHTKRNLQGGYKFDISETLSQREFFNNFFGLNTSFKASKSEIKLNLGFNKLKPWEKLLTRYDIIDSDLSSRNEGISIANRDEYILGTGIYYPINDKDYFSLDYNFKLMRTNGDIDATSVFDINNLLDEIETHTENQDDRDYHNGNINYNKVLGKGNLFMGVQYSSFGQSVSTFIENNFNQNGFRPEQDRNQDFGIESYSARLDYERVFESETKVEFGVNSTISNGQTSQFISPFDIQNPKTETEYEYDEQIHAAYTQVSRSFGKVNLSGGLRLENATVVGKFTKENVPLIDRDNLYFLPKVQLSLPIDSMVSMTINYARNITRPNFSNLSQIEVYINPFLVFSRNINLRPTLTHEIATNWQVKNKSLNVRVYYQTDPVNWSSSYDASVDLFKTTLTNFEKMYGVSATVNLPLTRKKWTSFNTISLNLNKIEDDNALQLSSSPYVYFYTNHSFQLPNKFSASINAWGFSKRKEGAYERNALFVAGVGISRLLYDKLSCTINFNNIFNNRSFKEFSSVNSVEAFNGFFVDSREVSLALKYSFGSRKSEYKNKKVDDSNRVR